MSTLRQQLQVIYDENGKLTPELTVQAARQRSHPLHSRFEWDNKIAGPKYREVQARELIRSVKVKYRKLGSDTEDHFRYFVSVRGNDGQAYRPAEDVAHDDLLTEIVLRDMEREWRQLKDRYGHFVEFVRLVRQDTEAAA